MIEMLNTITNGNGAFFFILIVGSIFFFFFFWLILPTEEQDIASKVECLYALLFGNYNKKSHWAALSNAYEYETFPICIKEYMQKRNMDSFVTKYGRTVAISKEGILTISGRKI